MSEESDNIGNVLEQITINIPDSPALHLQLIAFNGVPVINLVSKGIVYEQIQLDSINKAITVFNKMKTELKAELKGE